MPARLTKCLTRKPKWNGERTREKVPGVLNPNSEVGLRAAATPCRRKCWRRPRRQLARRLSRWCEKCDKASPPLATGNLGIRVEAGAQALPPQRNLQLVIAFPREPVRVVWLCVGHLAPLPAQSRRTKKPLPRPPWPFCCPLAPFHRPIRPTPAGTPPQPPVNLPCWDTL